jgi:hypothetical protein
MRHAAFACSLVLSGCCFNPFPYVPPDAGVAPDSGVAVDGGEDDGGVGDGGATDSGFVFDGGVLECPPPAGDGGGEPPNTRFVGWNLTLPDCAVRGVRYEPTEPCDARARVLGLWKRCTPTDGGTPLDADLLEIRTDSWHLLEVTDAGVLRRLDLDGSGRVRFLDDPFAASLIELQVETPQGAWQLWRPAFEQAPDRLRVTSGGSVVDFARATAP